MTHKDSEIPLAATDAKAGPSRRILLRAAGGVGIAGVAGGMLVDTSGAASAATAPAAPARHVAAEASAPLVAHVHNALTGEVDLYTGEQHVRVQDPALARALARAAATAR